MKAKTIMLLATGIITIVSPFCYLPWSWQFQSDAPPPKAKEKRIDRLDDVRTPHKHGYAFYWHRPAYDATIDEQRLTLELVFVGIMVSSFLGGMYFQVERKRQRKAVEHWRGKWEYNPHNDPRALLRAASTPTSSDQILLRPASENATTSSQELLRAHPHNEE